MGDVARERWRLEYIVGDDPDVRRRQLPIGVTLLYRMPWDRHRLSQCESRTRSPWLSASGIPAGAEGTPKILALVENALTGEDRCEPALVEDALDHLRRLRDATAIAPLLSLLSRCPAWAAKPIGLVLRSLGLAAVDPILGAYHAAHAAHDIDFRALLVELLTSSRVTDRRILGICCEWLPNEPAFAADMLADYGDPVAIDPLRGRLHALTPTTSSAAEQTIAVAGAIESLGGTLTASEKERRRTATDAVVAPLRERLRLLSTSDPSAAEEILALASAIEAVGEALSRREHYQRMNASEWLQVTRAGLRNGDGEQ